MVIQTMTLTDGRPGPEAKTWDLPPWGHGLGRTVMPLFIRSEGLLIPAGTAFWVGRAVSFVLTATHTLVEALRREGRFDHQLSRGEWPASSEFKHTGLYVLHTEDATAERGRVSFIPLESLDGAPPGDVVFGYPQFEAGRVTGSLPLSFDPPRIGETVWSVGYRNILPRDGIPFAEAQANTFDLAHDYSHQFTVVEGVVERIFTQRFARGFLEGPCFSFDQTIDHGLSGGPVISQDGRIVGINSAGADLYFGRPAALASMLYPLLMTPLRFGAQIGPVRLNASRALADLIGQGVVASDGSETHVSLRADEDQPGVAIGPRIPVGDHDFVHDDFAGFQRGETAQKASGSLYRLVRPQGYPG